MELSGQLHLPAALTPQKELSVPNEQDGLTPLRVCSFGEKKKKNHLSLTENKARTVQPVT